MSRIGDRMFSVAPINEPWCVGWLSHFMGYHAPGLRDIRATAHAMHNILLGHGRAIETMRGLGMDNLGGVFNFEWAEPADDSAAARDAAALYDAYYNRFFLGGVFQGRYPDLVMDAFEPHMPKGWQDDFPVITQPIDWCGLNYYTRKLIGPTDGPWPAHEEVEGPLPKTHMGWEIYPEGLYKFLKRTAAEYTGDLPLYVTENGMANPDRVVDGKVLDQARIDFLSAHLAKARQAIAEGVPLEGYMFWSLLDNYEWTLGYEKRFGLVHVDFETLTRTPKSSYFALQKALQNG
jgi:beta-glucosidase